MKHKLVFLVIAILSGCGGVHGEDLFGTHDTTTGTGTGTGTATNPLGGAGGTGGTGGTGLKGCSPSVTCQSIGAECGVIQNDGCGQQINCTNTCIAPFVCGGGNSQFQCGCTPKTCDELGKNCGLANDGCNGTIDCGSCNPNTYQTTCGNAWIFSDNKSLPPQPNVCGGGCGRQTGANASGICANMAGHTVEWQCDSNSMPTMPVAPSSDCIQPSSTNKYAWCCSN